MNSLKIAFQIFFTLTILYFLVSELVKQYKDRKKINEKLKHNSVETEDLRIYAMFYRTFIINFGEDYQYAKFKFSDDEVYIYLRNSLPTTYNGPFAIKFNEKNNYSYFTKFYLTRLEITGSELSITFKHKYFIGAKYGLSISNISISDAELIKSKLK